LVGVDNVGILGGIGEGKFNHLRKWRLKNCKKLQENKKKCKKSVKNCKKVQEIAKKCEKVRFFAQKRTSAF